MDLFIQVVDALVTIASLVVAFKAGVSREADPRWAGQLVFAAAVLGLIGIVL